MKLQYDVFLKKLFLVLKNELLHKLQFSKTPWKNFWEGVQFSEFALVHKNLLHFFNLFDKRRQLFIFKLLDYSINWFHFNGQCILRFCNDILILFITITMKKSFHVNCRMYDGSASSRFHLIKYFSVAYTK